MKLSPTITVFVILCAIVITTLAAPVTQEDIVKSNGKYFLRMPPRSGLWDGYVRLFGQVASISTNHHLSHLPLSDVVTGLVSHVPPRIFVEGEYGEHVEGDMVLTKEQQDAIYNTGINTRNGVLNSALYWPNATVVYDINVGDKDKIVIENAMADIEKNSCVKFRLRKDSSEHAVIIEIKPDGCYSAVGRSPPDGFQWFNLDYRCIKHGTVIHELLHTLGFYHMQSTYNRDDYVTIMWDNILPHHKHNFKKYDSEKVSNFGVTYDYGSVMHYEANAFSRNGQDTIVPKQKNVTIGQRDGLSKGDILKLNRMYKCPGTSNN